MRQLRLFILLCFLVFSIKADQKTNIILIMADDMGYECVGANGGAPYKSPVLDRLSANGARFTHGYAQPLCTPSRVKIMTGQYNVRNYVTFGVLDRQQKTFAHLFKDKGYSTCIAGKWQLGKEQDAPQHFGFDESCLWQHFRLANRVVLGSRKKVGTRYKNPRLEVNGNEVDYDKGEYGPEIVSNYICDFIERKKDQPFLVYYPMILPHSPFPPTPDSVDPNCTDNTKNFVDMVQYIDKIIGKIESQLKKSGVRDNTLLIFTCDNGTAGAIRSKLHGKEYRGGKGKMTNAGTHVPLIVSWPAVIKKGFVSDGLVDLSDMLPTICEAAGISIPKNFVCDGQSFLPVLKGKKEQVRDWAYVWYQDKKGEVQAWARTQQYKLYQSGAFFDVSKDLEEKDRLIELSNEQKELKEMLSTVLNKYAALRESK